METSLEYQQLRAAVSNVALPIGERQSAAEHLVRLMVAGVPVPADDDAEILELRTPWKDDGKLGSNAPAACRARNEVFGWHVDGPTLSQAKRHVHDRHMLRLLLAIIVDESVHRLERLEACRVVLGDNLRPRSPQRRNNYSPEKLLAEVLPSGAFKLTASGRAKVSRPPLAVADVW